MKSIIYIWIFVFLLLSCKNEKDIYLRELQNPVIKQMLAEYIRNNKDEIAYGSMVYLATERKHTRTKISISMIYDDKSISRTPPCQYAKLEGNIILLFEDSCKLYINERRIFFKKLTYGSIRKHEPEMQNGWLKVVNFDAPIIEYCL